jgi:hypothetical protein
MKIIVCEEKDEHRYFGPFETNEEREALAKKILEKRIADGYWYDEAALKEAKSRLERGMAWHFLQWRYGYEYESVFDRELNT